MEKNAFDKIKNIILPAALVCLGVGFFILKQDGGAASVEENEPDDTVVEKVVIVTRAESSEPEEIPAESSEAEPVPVWAEIPELSCEGIEFEDGHVIFAVSDGGYAIIDKDSALTDSFRFTADIGEVTVSCKKGKLSFTCGGEEVSGFVYGSHSIEYKDGQLFRDKSPVVYVDTAFCAYRLNDEYNIECTSVGKYVLRKNDGSITGHCVIKDDTGLVLDIYASDDGFEAVDADDLLEMAVKLNGDLLVTSWDLRLYVNGWELVPPGHNRSYSAKEEPDSSSAAESSEEEDESSGDDSSQAEEEKKPTFSNVSEVPLTPMKPAAKRGSANWSNEGVSELSLELIRYVNEVRREYGLGDVYGLPGLDGAAEIRAEEAAEEYSHERPDGSDYKTVLDECGLSWWTCAENLAQTGSEELRPVFDAWIASEEIRSTFLDPKVKYIAIACHENKDNKFCWVQLSLNDVYVPD
ncbi:MAG: CAP domain-containing protein [Ruminococcus sp.]|nr:CAP domain-containing protein [Ruminococcus sp.]